MRQLFMSGCPMKVVIFGSSGRHRARIGVAGARARASGNRIRAQPVEAQAHLDAALTLVQGDVAEAAAVERALDGQDAVLCALGAATPLKRDPELVTGIKNIVRAMERGGPRRLIYLSFLGVSSGRGQLSLLGRYVVAPLVFRHVVADHEAKERIITQSSLDWTIVRPPRLTNGPLTGTYRHGNDIKATSVVP